MTIQKSASQVIHAGHSTGVRNDGVGGSTTTNAYTTSQARVSPERGDKGPLPEESLAFSAQPSSRAGEARELSQERIAQIRKRVLEGAYDSVGVVEEVARRMLERGDI